MRNAVENFEGRVLLLDRLICNAENNLHHTISVEFNNFLFLSFYDVEGTPWAKS